MATRYIMTYEVIRQEEARLQGRFEAYPVNGRKTSAETIKKIRKEIGNMTFRIARKCNVSVNYPKWSIQGKKWSWASLQFYFRHCGMWALRN